MAKKNSVPTRIDKGFKEMLNDIKIEKIKNGTAVKMLNDIRLTQAISKIPELKETLINARFKDGI